MSFASRARIRNYDVECLGRPVSVLARDSGCAAWLLLSGGASPLSAGLRGVVAAWHPELASQPVVGDIIRESTLIAQERQLLGAG